ncbi:hypothetical protein V1477_004574, partial [Vespula maculifrons]
TKVLKKKFNNDSDNPSDKTISEDKRERERNLLQTLVDPDIHHYEKQGRLYFLIAYDMTGVRTDTDTCTHIHMKMRACILGPEGKKARSPIDRSRHNVNTYVELFTAKGRKGLERLDIFHCNKV